MDSYYHIEAAQKREIGNDSINSIVEKTKNYHHSPERLTEIASLITKNFTDYWWPYQEDRFCSYQSNPNAKIPYGWCSPYYGTPLYRIFDENRHYAYVKDKRGHVVNYDTTDLSVNAEWIAYQQAGNCQQISVLFNETANRSGFISRVVRARGFDHMWNEIQINGSWKIFDIQQFGKNNGSDIKESKFWNADPPEYVKFQNKTNMTVFTLTLNDVGFGENITDLYYPKT